eukprot:m.251309 g.251309  ORF g.251309 m.251309 type:complete len:88 (-) comp17153_c0_seq1:123-386(-)
MWVGSGIHSSTSFSHSASMAFTVDDYVFLFGGSTVLAAAALAHFNPKADTQAWALAAFMGANLAQYAFSGFCPLAYVLKSAGCPQRK